MLAHLHFPFEFQLLVCATIKSTKPTNHHHHQQNPPQKLEHSFLVTRYSGTNNAFYDFSSPSRMEDFFSLHYGWKQKEVKILSWFWTARSALNIAGSLKFLKSFLFYKKEGGHRLDSVLTSPSCLRCGLACREVIMLGSSERPIKTDWIGWLQQTRGTVWAGELSCWVPVLPTMRHPRPSLHPGYQAGPGHGWDGKGPSLSRAAAIDTMSYHSSHGSFLGWANAVLGCRKSGIVPRDLLQGLLLTHHFSTDRISCWHGYSLIPRQG